jgi:hypothetical protein
MADDDWGFAPPPFRPDAALQQLRRSLRDLRLDERAGGFESRGRRLLEMSASDTQIDARIARRPATSPEWENRRLASAADVRRFLDEVRQRLARWADDD